MSKTVLAECNEQGMTMRQHVLNMTVSCCAVTNRGGASDSSNLSTDIHMFGFNFYFVRLVERQVKIFSTLQTILTVHAHMYSESFWLL